MLLQDAGMIAAMRPCLAAQQPLAVQVTALRCLDALCKLSPARQEAAAVEGMVPLLAAIIRTPPLTVPKGSSTGVLSLVTSVVPPSAFPRAAQYTM